ncbi:MAG TPA: PAS domain S-box protein [Methanoregula sp.]|nr:PAS domain S-box protein [Methanoregula sp.]
MISVLCVDNDPALLEALKKFMERGGEFRVDTVFSAREAIGRLKNERYDALVAEYLMPDMDGIELLKYIRPRCNRMPFILFTGNGGEDVAIEALNTGADFYLRKGSEPRTGFAELETKIRSAVARRQSEQALRHSEFAYRMLVENLADIIYTVNDEEIVTYASPRISRFGYDSKDVVGKDFSMLLCAEDIPPVAHNFAEIKQGIISSFDFRITDKSGLSRWVRASGQPLIDHGKCVGVQGLLTEITEDKRIDEALKGREVLHGQLLDTAPDGMLILDSKTWTFVEFNEEACRQLGYSREEFAGLTLRDLEVADAPEKLREKIPEILKKGQLTFETRHQAKDDSIHDIIVTARAVDGDKQKKIAAIFHDATREKVQTQALINRADGYEKLYNQSPVACLIFTPDGYVTSINRAGTELLGCKKDEISGKTIEGFISPDEQEQFRTIIKEMAHSGNPCSAARFTLLRKGGDTRFVSLEGSAIRDPAGKATQLCVLLSDITGMVEENETLRSSAAVAKGVIAGARDGIIACTPELIVSDWNTAMEDISGIPVHDAQKQPLAEMLPFMDCSGPDSAPVRALSGEIVASPESRYEYPGTKKRGWLRAVFSPLRDDTGKIEGIIGVVQEITVRTTAVQRIRAKNRLYAISSAVNAIAAKTRELETLLTETCRISAQEDAVRMAWIGLFDHTAGILRPVAHDGNMEFEEFLQKDGYRVTDTGEADALACDAICKGEPVVCPDTGAGYTAGHWREVALSHGIRSLAAIPFRLKGEIVGAITLCSAEPDAFSDAESEELTLLGSALSEALDLLDKKTLQRRAGKGSHGSWERTRFLANGLESSSVPFAAVFSDGTTGAVNAALCSLLGYSEDELLTLPFTNLFSGDNTDKEKWFSRVLATKRPERYECAITTKNGSRLPVEIFLQAMTDETSGESCISLFITNISERKQKTDLLTDERQQYHTFFVTASAPMLVTTSDGTILAANPAACRLFGTTSDALSAGKDSVFGQSGDPRFVELSRTCERDGNAEGDLRLLGTGNTPLDVAVGATRIPDLNGKPAMNLVLWDITEQKKAGETLAQDQSRTIAILDHLPNPLRRCNADGTAVFFNRAWFGFTGRSFAEEKGDGWKNGIHPDDRDRYCDACNNPGACQSTDGIEYRLLDKTGTYRWIREIAIPDPAVGGTGAGTTCSCFDIHEWKLAEAALAAEKAQYRAIFDSTADATLLVNGHIIDCNAAATRLFACSENDLIGHDPLEHSPKYQPDGRASAEAVHQYLKAARGGTPQAFQWVSTKSDGTPLETRVTLTALDIHGEQRVLVVIADMTEQKLAEREIQRLLSFPQMNPNPVIEVRPDRTIPYTNPATARVLSSMGLPDDPAVLLPSDFDAIVKTLRPKEPVMIDRVVQVKERSFHETLCSADGPSSLRIYAYDITDQVLAAEALAYANHKLNILTSITRHDIQNKLTGVIGYLDLLRASLRDPQLIGFIDKAESAATAIRHHIEFTKDYECLGGTAPVWQEIAPIIANVRSHFDVGGIAFEEPDAGFAVFADPMFAKVIYNLCDNSIRHGVYVRHIRIKSEPVKAGCMLTYEDDGAGIPEDKKELIFERGFTTTAGSAKSSGLGLFLVRDILAITGITIKETGVPGKGSRFEMLIPPGKWKTGVAK